VFFGNFWLWLTFHK